MASSSKRQTTFAKMQREQRVKEKRALKAEKKQAAREAKAAGLMFGGEAVEGETVDPDALDALDEPIAADVVAGEAPAD